MRLVMKCVARIDVQVCFNTRIKYSFILSLLLLVTSDSLLPPSLCFYLELYEGLSAVFAALVPL